MTKQKYVQPALDVVELHMDEGVLRVLSTKMLLLLDPADMTINGPEDW
jgi:hypothetical protein